MTEPIASAVRVAATPEQAQIFVAMLKAEGIPAHVDGDSLADEFAMSRRLMNLSGTRVMVPTGSLERAREILDVAPVDAEELAQQAMAADREPAAAPAARAGIGASPSKPMPWAMIALVAIAAALVFAVLWLEERVSGRAAEDPVVRYEPYEFGLRTIRRADGVLLSEAEDRDRDGVYELLRVRGNECVSEATDADRNGRYETYVERRAGLVFTWSDRDADGLFDACVVTNAAGAVVQELGYERDKGFAVSPR